ncbi:type II toxin-antitoxin system RatA family toxin [Paralimibaculum aggregatum]|uniref:Type II toxin-antitoxin system RatA family toxin n=1 Tax=Paralimibaculum aggregatum TaxID=3036245 RepID=A0ABQ6LRB3_9RHOB|nr:type II toxin-antitoxin system RatA family toxin [Limibaculum sp. NKW23]
MPTHGERRQMPHSADQMFDLIADIGKYPDFLPWCSGARIRSRKTRADGAEVIEADLVISFKVYRERFTSRVVLKRSERVIDVAYLDGPFRYLDNHWTFEPEGPDACTVDFFVDFEFRSRTLQAVIGAVFNTAMQRIVSAFERRAEALYGGGGGTGTDAADPDAAAAVTTRAAR